jgi:mitochondrial import inner membrane translocase subunit TIM16
MVCLSSLIKPRSPIRRISTNIPSQAHRLISQIVFTGTRVVGRAFVEAWKQAAASQKYAASSAKNPGSAKNFAASGLTLDEACKILNVAPPKGGKVDMENVMERFKKLFDQNEPKKGGSFYLQSKVLRARERIELEVRTAEEAAQREAEIKEGWNPKLYKDR